MSLYPAIVIGGPPDSGKSVLTAHLTQALRERGVQHYVLRACPDGEGDWAYLADRETVRTILVPRAWTHEFVELVCRDLERRPLPLIVDAGGRPRPWQEPIYDRCTHAITLCRSGGTLEGWDARIARHNLQLVADLRSDLRPNLGETSQIVQARPVLRAVLSGLEWAGAGPQGPAFAALVERVAALLDYDERALVKAHYDAAPVETVVDLDRLARALGVPHRGERPTWQPEHLPAALDYLPAGVPLALYGRGPNWLYAALALLAHPAELWQFDARLGWMRPAVPVFGPAASESPLWAAVQPGEACTEITFSLPTAYLDYVQAAGLSVPRVPPGRGVLLSGKLPHWLLTGLALAYIQAKPEPPWLAVYQPHAGGAVVVYGPGGQPAVGSVRRCLSAEGPPPEGKLKTRSTGPIGPHCA